MNPEYYMIIAMGSGGILFALGGTFFKQIRRYALPFVLGLTAYFAGFELWKCLAFYATLTGVLHMGYGESLPYWRKALTFIAYVLPSLFLGFTLWQPIVAFSMLALFVLSNWKPTSKLFVWKICEFLMGTGLGIILASIISNGG